ncbi:hypothetical protein QJQ45_009685 [Haematococcus lacustris]|nr:hypothetical protein QJQ45_009685 [Haematococcus lacustris]
MTAQWGGHNFNSHYHQFLRSQYQAPGCLAVTVAKSRQHRHERVSGLAPRKPPQAPRSSHEATQPAASEPGPSTPPPAKRSKPAAEPTKGKGKGKAAKAKPAPQPGRWLDRDCNAALNMQRIGESRWRPLELCYWPDQGALPAKGKEYPGLGYKRLRDEPPKAQEQQQQPAEAQAVPEDPDFDIVDRDEARQPDLTEAQRKRKASEDVVAAIPDHVNKQAKKLWPDRILALAYGAAGFNGTGTIGCRGVPVSKMQKEAVRQFRPERVVLVDEFRTSRVSSADNTPSETLLDTPPESFRWLRPVKSMAKRSQVRGLMCLTSINNITRFYDRDVSAALNIRRCAVGPGPRPTELCYWTNRPAMPKPGQPGQEWVELADKPLLLKWQRQLQQ